MDLKDLTIEDINKMSQWQLVLLLAKYGTNLDELVNTVGKCKNCEHFKTIPDICYKGCRGIGGELEEIQ